MARTNTLANFLTDVANAIRTKKGTQETISASTFDTEILNLPSGTYQTKTLTISANGSQTITPDQGYDAIDEITITTQVPQKQLQTKSYNFTTNQTIQLTPDTGYDGFDIVTLTINVPQSSGGDIKLFETEQAMQADSDPHERDLAVVYRQSLNPVAVDSVFNNCIVKQSVTFSTAISDWIWCDFRSADESMWMPRVSVEIGPDSARVNIETETDYTTYEYETKDSMTYILVGYNSDQVVDLGADVCCSFPERWSDAIGLFIYISGGVFEGLYECGRVPTQLKGNLLSDLTVTDNNISTNSSITINVSYDELVERILSMATYIKTLYSHDDYSRYPFWCGLKDANTIVLLSSGSGSTPTSVMYLKPIFKYDTGVFVGMETSSNDANNAYEFSFNINTGDYINTTVVPLSLTNPDGNWHWNYTTDFNSYYMLGVIDYNSMSKTFTWMDKYVYCLSNTISSSTSNNTPSVIEGLKYNFATTQLTLSNPNELLPNKIGYGKNGVITGDSSVYDNLDYSLVSEQLGLTKYKTLSVSNSTLNSNKLYSLCGTNVETDASTYYRPIKYVLNPEYDFTEKMNTFVGDMAETKYLMKPEAFKCDNGYTCRLCIGVTNKKAYAVTHDDGNNIIYAELLFTTTQSNNSIYQHVVVDDDYYYFSAQYTTTNAIIKISRATGVISVNKFTVGVSHNTYLTQYSTFAELNNNLVYIDCNSSGRGNVLYITKNLEVIKNITYTYPDVYATEWSYPAVIIGNSIFWFIRCSKQRLFKFDGNSVTYSNEIGTGLGLTYMNHIFTDGTYIYGTWDGTTNIYKLNTSLQLVDTLPSGGYNSQLYNNLWFHNFTITDYANYTCYDAYGHKYTIQNGKLIQSKNRLYTDTLYTGTTVMNAHKLRDIVINDECVSYPVLAEFREGIYPDAYNTVTTEKRTDLINVTSLYVESNNS